MEKNVFMYWSGDEFKLIKLLREIIVHFSTVGEGYRLHLITEKTASDYFPDLPEGWTDVAPNYQSDIIGVWAVLKYGGIWLDADTLILENLDCLWDFEDGFFILENNEILCNGVFGLPKNSPIAEVWKKKIEMTLLAHRKSNTPVTGLGPPMLHSLSLEFPSLFTQVKLLKGLDTVYPINWDQCTESYLMKPYSYYKKYVREWQPFLVLVNSVYRSAEPIPLDVLKNKKQFPLQYFLQTVLKKIENCDG
jgi:hypothetical protein